VLAPPAGAEINFRGCWEGHICGGKRNAFVFTLPS